VQVAELRPGLWRWTVEHPQWEPGAHWEPDVACVFAELPEAVVLVDPLIPADPADAERFHHALARDIAAAGTPVYVLLTVHWHERSTETILERYGATMWRPEQPVDLPEGVTARVVRGADWIEAFFYLAPWQALIVGDLMIGDGRGGVRIPVDWFPTEEQDWARTELREMLRRATSDLDVDLLLVSHGDAVLEGGREMLERVLARGSTRG
jgi:hypothetical protein